MSGELLTYDKASAAAAGVVVQLRNSQDSESASLYLQYDNRKRGRKQKKMNLVANWFKKIMRDYYSRSTQRNKIN